MFRTYNRLNPAHRSLRRGHRPARFRINSEPASVSAAGFPSGSDLVTDFPSVSASASESSARRNLSQTGTGHCRPILPAHNLMFRTYNRLNPAHRSLRRGHRPARFHINSEPASVSAAGFPSDSDLVTDFPSVSASASASESSARRNLSQTGTGHCRPILPAHNLMFRTYNRLNPAHRSLRRGHRPARFRINSEPASVSASAEGFPSDSGSATDLGWAKPRRSRMCHTCRMRRCRPMSRRGILNSNRWRR